MPPTITNLGPCDCCGEPPAGCGCIAGRTATELFVSGTHVGTLTGPPGGPWGGTVTGAGCTFYFCVVCPPPPVTGTCGDYTIEARCTECGGETENNTCGACDPPPDPCSCDPFQLYYCCNTLTFELACCAAQTVDVIITL